jgi:hypothetical protein
MRPAVQAELQRQRERVHRLDIHAFIVAVGLGHGHLGEEIAQHCADDNITQGDTFAIDTGQCRCLGFHCHDVSYRAVHFFLSL